MSEVFLGYRQSLMGYLDLGFQKILRGMLCQFGKDLGILIKIFVVIPQHVERIFPLTYYVSSILLRCTTFHALGTGTTWYNKVC